MVVGNLESYGIEGIPCKMEGLSCSHLVPTVVEFLDRSCESFNDVIQRDLVEEIGFDGIEGLISRATVIGCLGSNVERVWFYEMNGHS